MKPLPLLLTALVPLLALDGCASTPAPAPAVARHRRRRAHPTVIAAPTDGTPAPNAPPAPGVPPTADGPLPVAHDAPPPPPPAIGAPIQPGVRPPAAIAARPVAAGAPANAFGTPVVTRAPGSAALTPRWTREARRQVLRCDGSVPPHLPESQSPPEPTIASIVRAFHPAERAVAACSPPSTPNGRLPVRGTFHGSGAPAEFSFPQMALTESQALCVGRALCELRLPVFRSINAQVSYDYVVYLTASE